MMKNILGKTIARQIGSYTSRENAFEFDRVRAPKIRPNCAKTKLVDSVDAVIDKVGLTDGMTISFHHHFRNGDKILEMVMERIKARGINNLRVACSSLTDAHECMIDYIKEGIVTRLETSGVRGELGKQISQGLMAEPVIIRSHGGRARALMDGTLEIDVAFMGVPSADCYGNASGARGKSRCGSLGYVQVDVAYADHVVLLTDTLVGFPNLPASITATNVDHVVVVDEIGDPAGIATGATRMTKNPRDLLLAEITAETIEKLDLLKQDFSMQTGSGGASIATMKFLKEKMINKGVTASFALGGITSPLVDMYKSGLIGKLLDAQTIDHIAIDNIAESNDHIDLSISSYANPFEKGCAVNMLSFVILSALEIDVDFNVNVLTGSDGVLRGASGGHSDTSEGAGVAIVIAPLVRGRIPTVVEQVNNVITPGADVDVFICDYGVSVNPQRQDLIDTLTANGVKVFSMRELKEKAENFTGKPDPIDYDVDKVVAVIEGRRGDTLDVVYAVNNQV